ncbi:WXG100 family type VII secretion target [Streptomyces sp. NPDC047043]|uniref:WXG100 family type VII secretion target n=1 Tax=unclassified Streptomyces TaxID=2593676 RepID=UPI00324EC95B
MADYIVNDEKTSATASSTMNEYDTAVAQLEKIKRDLDALTEDGYNTPAAKTKFKPFVEDFSKGYRSVVEGLTGISKYVDGVGKGFNQLDSDMGNSLSK